jgi:galactokinase
LLLFLCKDNEKHFTVTENFNHRRIPCSDGAKAFALPKKGKISSLKMEEQKNHLEKLWMEAFGLKTPFIFSDISRII